MQPGKTVLDQRDRTRVGRGFCMARFSDQVGDEDAIDDAHCHFCHGSGNGSM